MNYEQLSNLVVVLAALLAIKHFLADGILQFPYQYKNKGNLFHPGGYVHAGTHGILTGVAVELSWLLIFDKSLPLSIALKFIAFDAITHYLIDFAKMNLSGKSWSDVHTSDGVTYQRIFTDKFYYALVADQAAHFCFYGIIIAAAIRLCNPA